MHVTITINEAAKYYNREESKRKNKAEYILLPHYFRHQSTNQASGKTESILLCQQHRYHTMDNYVIAVNIGTLSRCFSTYSIQMVTICFDLLL